MKNNHQQHTEGGVKTRKKSTFYSLIATGTLLLAAAIVLIVLAASGVLSAGNNTIENGGNSQSSQSGSNGDDGGEGNGSGDGGDDVNTGATVDYVNPLETMTVINQQGFYYNTTLNCYYEHVGIDVSAEAGAEVYCIADGTVEGIYTADILQGTQVVIDHGDGVKSVYSFVEPVSALKAGDAVKQGDVIATVAEASGCEYKDGAHLHLEMYVEGVSADPANYLTLSEK